MAKNISVVRLLAVPLDKDCLHTLYFTSPDKQESYFEGKVKHTMDDCSYQRKDGVIRFNKPYDDLLTCNYVMYKNPAYKDKWVYAFITRMEYVDDGRTNIYIETDPIQTWLFDYTVKPSFIEREHVKDDTPGKHTVPEGLETGEYVSNRVMYDDNLLKYGIVLATTLNLSTYNSTTKKADSLKTGQIYNGIYSGCNYYYFDCESGKRGGSVTVDEVTIQDLKMGTDALGDIIYALSKSSQTEGITSIFMCPKNMIETEDEGCLEYAAGDMPALLQKIKNGNEVFEMSWEYFDGSHIPKPTHLNNYSNVKNNKLFTFPYTYLMMDNNAGSTAIYHYENFATPDCQFLHTFAITPGGSMRTIPLFYKGIGTNESEGLTGGKYPICSFPNDVYTNWLTQNSINFATNIATQTISTAGSLATSAGMFGGAPGAAVGAVVGAVVGGVNAVIQNAGEKKLHSLIPAHLEGNVNSGDVVFADKVLGFTGYEMTIKKEYAEIIDGFFTMFGYKVNVVKTPEEGHREGFWYTKTVDVNIDGDIPQDDMQKIKDVYNRGFTFWRNTSKIGDYSISNTIGSYGKR